MTFGPYFRQVIYWIKLNSDARLRLVINAPIKMVGGVDESNVSPEGTLLEVPVVNNFSVNNQVNFC